MSRPRVAAVVVAALLSLVSWSARAADLVLDVEARHIRGDRSQVVFEVSDGAVLRSGDGLRIRLEVLEPKPVHLVFVGSSGNPTMVLPAAAEDVGRALPPGTVIEVPPGGAFFTLDDNVGDEAVFAFTGDTSRENLRRLLEDMRSAEGDIAAISRMLRERFDTVERVAFQHISAEPLVGIDVSAPELRGGSGEDASLGDLTAETTRPPQRPRGEGPRFTIPQDVGDEMDEVLSEEGSLIPRGVGGADGSSGKGQPDR